LIYLDRTAQAAVLEMFAYALKPVKPGGYLFLGNAESVDAFNTAFETVSKEHRIYQMSGLELMERARELRPAKHFRSVAITGYGSEANAREALAAGFDAHVCQADLHRASDVNAGTLGASPCVQGKRDETSH
jgi:CheY-like chemotaxis protein